MGYHLLQMFFLLLAQKLILFNPVHSFENIGKIKKNPTWGQKPQI